MSDDNVRINLTIPKQLKLQLMKVAQSKGLSLNAYIRMILLSDNNK